MREKLTPKMRAHLIELRDCGPGPRPPRSNVGYRCMSARYTEWVYEDTNGDHVCQADAWDRHGPDWRYRVKNLNVEAITPAGRRALLESDGGGDAA